MGLLRVSTHESAAGLGPDIVALCIVYRLLLRS